MLKTYIDKWTIQRLIQLAIGSYFIWNYIEDESRISLVFGGVMLYQAILNVGCFGSKGCSTPVSGADKAQPFAKDIKKIN